MKTQIYLFAGLLVAQPLMQSLAHSAPPPIAPLQQAKTALQKLKEQCDNPKTSNESEWISYASKTESIRCQSISELKLLGEVGLVAVRNEKSYAKDEYQQMLMVTLAALGDKPSIPATAKLMLEAEKPAVRFVAAMELRKLKDKELIEPFKKALSDPFKRKDGGCVGPGIIYPVRLVASDALVELGLSLQEVRKIGVWWDYPDK